MKNKNKKEYNIRINIKYYFSNNKFRGLKFFEEKSF